jgi:hypothetical protein
MERSFTDEDVVEFLDSDWGHVDRFNASDDHPFRTPSHSGAWPELVADALAENRDNWQHIAEADVPTFWWSERSIVE